MKSDTEDPSLLFKILPKSYLGGFKYYNSMFGGGMGDLRQNADTADTGKVFES